MANMELSKRMKTIADMVIPGGTLADIGCDHAFVSIYLVENNIVSRAVASDVRSGPVAIAKDNVAGRNLTARIDVRLGNGLETLAPGEADTIVIAGMGGMLMLDILRAGEDTAKKCRQLILQPQSDICRVRKYLLENGYLIFDENMLIDDGKYYNILDVRPSSVHEDYTEDYELYLKFGKCLLKKQDDILLSYMKKQYRLNSNILHGLAQKNTDNARARSDDLKCEQEMILQAIGKFYSE